MAAAVDNNNNNNNNNGIDDEEIRQLLQENIEQGIINNEEFVLLHELLEEEGGRRNINILHLNYPEFNLESWSEDECWVDLRFRKEDIPRLVQALHLPDEFITSNRV